jgi:hypothetical protein
VKQVRFRSGGMEMQTELGGWVPARIVAADQSERVESVDMADYPRESVFPPEDSGVTRDSDDFTRLHRLLDAAGIDPSGSLVDRVTKLATSRHAFGSNTQVQVPEDILTRQQEVEAAVEEITAWWRVEAEEMIAKSASKAVEYGAHDLEIMGVGMSSLVHAQLAQATSEERSQFGQYAAVAFYLMGKVSRMMSALEQGTLPKGDTEFDIAVYAFMAMRIRQTGRWV